MRRFQLPRVNKDDCDDDLIDMLQPGLSCQMQRPRGKKKVNSTSTKGTDSVVRMHSGVFFQENI